MNTKNAVNQQETVWPKIIGNSSPEGMLRIAMQYAAYSLSDMAGRSLKVDSLRVETVPISQLTMWADDPEMETVGIYLLMGDSLPGQAVLTLSLADAMYLVDWLLEARPGTTTRLTPLACSALAEFGNQALASFLNALAEFTGNVLRLSPPAVMVDMLAAVLQTTIIPVAATTNELLIIETAFADTESSLLVRFWVLPDPAALSVD